MGRTMTIPANPKRVISIVPSQSEFLWDIGLADSLVGITKFCIHPDEMFRSVPHVGGTKKLNIGKIRSLQPDLIIGNKEENEKADIEELEKHFPVWMSDIYDLNDALQMMKATGKICGKEAKAKKIIAAIQDAATSFNTNGEFRTAYLIWKDPIMVAGGNNFIEHQLQRCGLTNVFGGKDRYPVITPEELKQANPQLILLSSEPYPFGEKHIPAIKEICEDARIELVDGELFSWYGSRLLKAFPYMDSFIKRISQEG